MSWPARFLFFGLQFVKPMLVFVPYKMQKLFQNIRRKSGKNQREGSRLRVEKTLE